jgi:hypothetical protein
MTSINSATLIQSLSWTKKKRKKGVFSVNYCEGGKVRVAASTDDDSRQLVETKQLLASVDGPP